MLSRWRSYLVFVFVSLFIVLGWANNGKCGQKEEGGLSLCADCRELESFIKQVAIEDMEREVWDNYYDTVNNDDWYDDDYGDDDYDYDDDDGDSGRGADYGFFGCGCYDYSSGDDDESDDDYDGTDDDSADDDYTDDDSADDDDQDFSETNVQEEGVDEADLTKTDGNYLYYLTDYGPSDSRLLVFKVWPPEETNAIFDLEFEGKKIGIFLYQDWVLVLTSLSAYSLNDDIWPGVDRSNLCQYILKLTLVNVSNPFEPVVKREVYIEGEHVGSRRIEGSARIVAYKYPAQLNLETYIDPWDYYTGGRLDEEKLKQAYEALIEKNKQIIMQTPLEVFLTRYYDIIHSKDEIRDGFLCACENTYIPNQHFGFGILSIITVFFDEALIKQNDACLVAEGSIVYASKNNLFVTASTIAGREWGDPNRSEVHKFDISSNPTEVSYLASGWVDGWALNQFSMSEYEGFFRIATTIWRENGDWDEDDSWEEVSHNVFVLKQEDSSLVTVGEIRDIARWEELKAVRFLGKRGFIVTFRRTDPLFTIDLSDPYNPELVGELWIPGYSNYIHPMGEDYLLTVGVNGDEWGDTWGVALNIFDVSDFENPQLIHQEEVGGYDSSSPAQEDHHAFLYFKDILSIPLVTGPYNDEWKGKGKTGFCGFYVYRVSPEIGFEMQGAVNHAGDYSNKPTRSTIIEDYLYTLSLYKLVTTRLDDFAELVELEF